MRDGDTLVEYEALALPFTLRLGNIFEVAQYATLQMIDFIYALSLKEGCRFFAPDASSAEHRKLCFACCKLCAMCAKPFGEFTK